VGFPCVMNILPQRLLLAITMPKTSIIGDKVELGIVLDRKQYEQLKRVSQKYNVSMSALIRILIERYINSLDSQPA